VLAPTRGGSNPRGLATAKKRNARTGERGRSGGFLLTIPGGKDML
jgi:hypothetical protein